MARSMGIVAKMPGPVVYRKNDAFGGKCNTFIENKSTLCVQFLGDGLATL